MARFNAASLEIADDILSRYPVKKSATIPLAHLAQEQDGWVTDEAMAHIAELVECSAAEVKGTVSFYEMLKLHPTGDYQINICHGIACHLLGADDLLHHAEEKLGIKDGGITADGTFAVEGVECIAACTEAPCLSVNYRYVNKVSNDDFDGLVDDIAAGRRSDIPKHGTLAKTRQHIPDDRRAGVAPPDVSAAPIWLARNTPKENA